MNCHDFEKLALLQDSGELEDSQRQALAEHLNHCAACREFRVNLAVLRQTLKAASTRLPDGPAAKVLETIHVAATQHRPLQRWAIATPWRGVWAAAASLTLCLLGMKLFLTQPMAGSESPGNAQGYATEIVPLVAMVMGNETLPTQYSNDSELGVLADQLLILQGINGDSKDDVAEDFSLLEDILPTTLQWNNSPGLQSGKRV